MSSATHPLIVLHGTKGLQVLEGNNFNELTLIGDKKEEKVKCFDVAQNGKYLAYATVDHKIKVVSLPDFQVVFEKDNTPITSIVLSPKANILATWHLSSHNQNNLNFYSVFTGVLLKSLHQKRQARWWPHWSPDEHICVNHINSELFFFEKNSFDKYVRKLFNQKVTYYSMTTNKQNGKHYIACYTTGSKGQPDYVRIYEYPKFESLGLANKSFYQADYVEFIWNYKGDAVLLFCQSDVDKSGKSYYGEQKLHYLDIKGNTFIIKLNKPGPIHNVIWLPSIKESIFCVIYGLMPAKASLFNTKADIIFDFGESMINQISFNPHGNLLALSGFGNLRGEVQIWNVKTKKKIADFKAPDTTSLEWCPDGIHIMTATTSPRLRVGNGFRVWLYNGRKIHEDIYPVNTELYNIKWQPNDSFPEPAIDDGLVPILPKVKEPEPVKYVPPHLRKNIPTKNNAPSTKTNLSKEDKDKKIKNLSRKLEQIEKLKELKTSGKQLEKNQIEKINKEDEILAELAELKFHLEVNKSDWEEN